MATVYAVANGNWSNAAIWNTGSLPTTSDDVRSNNKTIVVDGNFTVLSVSNAPTTPAAGGGQFSLVNNSVLTATAGGFIGFNGTTISFSNTQYNQTATLVGAVWGPNNTSAITVAVSNAFNSTFNIIGDVYNANPSGSVGSSAYTIYHNGFGLLNITGSVISNVNGGGSFNNAVLNNNIGYLGITGSITNTQTSGGGSTNGSVRNENGAGYLLITGNLYGGPSTSSSGSACALNNGTMLVYGSIFAGVGSPAIYSGSVSQRTFLTGPLISSNTYGVQAVTAGAWRWIQSNSGITITAYTSNLLAARNLYSAEYTTELMMPATSNVRSGVIYGPSNELTGTMAVPNPVSVSYGVPVDNTTGTGAITPADIWNYLTDSANTANTMGDRLRNCATVETTGDQVALGM